LNADAAIRAVRHYNEGSYRRRTNIEIDAEAYARFSAGLPDDPERLTALIRFVGEEYGGAQSRFLLHGYREEAALIVRNLLPILGRFRELVASAHPLSEAVPDESALAFLFDPFRGSMRWPVWASKTLHFLRPDVFPILDSRAKKALGLTSLENSAPNYRVFCEVFREVLVSKAGVLTTARDFDKGSSPSDLKLLDKILYELGA
jgi:hypothetical protein